MFNIYQRRSPENALIVKFCVHFVTVRNGRYQHPSRSATKLGFGGARRFSAQPRPGFNFTTSLPLAITASARRDTPSQSEPGRKRPPPGRRGQAKAGPPPGNAISSSWRSVTLGCAKPHATSYCTATGLRPADQSPDCAAWYRALSSDPTRCLLIAPSV